jgi:PAS domain S-box-containing protein
MERINETSIKTEYIANMKNISFNLTDILPAAIYTCDAQGIITYYNEAAARLWGREPEIGKDLWCGSWKIYYPNGSPMPLDSCPMAVSLKEKRPVVGEDIIVERPDGIKVNILPHPKPIFNDEGEMTGAINMLVDITDKIYSEKLIRENQEKYKSLSELLEKKVEERTATLKESEERYHKMVEEVQDYAILLLNKDGYILNWNKGAEKIKGYTEAEIVGKSFRVFYQDKDRQEKLPERLIKEAHDTGRAMHEGWRVRKDGTKFWGSIVITALHNEDNEVIGFSKVTRDLTERKLAEDQLKHYLKDIEFRNKQLEEYAYIASHDLQEPLRKIQIFAELLEDNIDNKEQAKKNLEKITSSAKRMSSLIKDVLKYSQLSTDDEIYVETDLNNIIDTVLEDYSMLIEQKNVKITYDLLPSIKGIPIQLHQLFSNLVSNAIKFSSEDPEIEITSAVVKGPEDKYPELTATRDYLNIMFKDNGIGFEQQYGEQVFKMFKRLSNNVGTGIGLALCKKIVENHSGHIHVDSTPNVGTTFTLYLPVS